MSHDQITKEDLKMAMTDLSNYNLSELKRLQHDIEKEIENRRQREVKLAREQILMIAQDMGLSVEELLASVVKKPAADKTDKIQRQYMNPVDSSQTWSGRGRQPKWIVDGLAKGKTLDDFRI
jgi:DNA-binding protein H-NS